jgi:hypothetical protein
MQQRGWFNGMATSLMVSLIVLLSACMWSSSSPQLVAAQSAHECILCQMSAGYVWGWITSNATESFMIKELEVVCSVAPAPWNQQCDALVQQYVPQLNGLYPWPTIENICADIGACTS